MNSNPNWQPATAAERYRIIDIIRGLALFGVLLVNILTDFRVPLLEHILRPFPDPDPVNRYVDLLAAFALEFKSFTIFSFLFGVGIAIQIERAAARNVRARNFLVRRLAWLFVFGAIHLFLIWNGDILTLYAVCGLLLLPFLNLPWPALLTIGAVLIAIPEFVSFPQLPSGPAAEAAIGQARLIYGNGGFPAISNFRWRESWFLIVPLLIQVLPRTAGLMFWGVAAWRSGILRDAGRHRRKLLFGLAAGASIGGAMTLNNIWAASSGHALWPALRNTRIEPSILLALAYVSAFLLWLNNQRAAFLNGIAAIGRTALTNYLLQSIILGFIFYGYGLGLFGRIGSAAAAGIGLLLYVAQVQLSKLWLEHFRFGPFEWLWRSVTYGHQQMLREHSLPSQAAIDQGGSK